MKISTRARYGLRLMVDIARQYDGLHPVQLRQVAEGNNLSLGYLEQLMISLRNASLVRGLSGRKGGYILARPADQIRITEIVEATIGPINLADCVRNPKNCPRSPVCESRPIWALLNTMILDVLGRYTLADMTDARWLERINRELPSSLLVYGGKSSPTAPVCGSSRLRAPAARRGAKALPHRQKIVTGQRRQNQPGRKQVRPAVPQAGTH